MDLIIFFEMNPVCWYRTQQQALTKRSYHSFWVQWNEIQGISRSRELSHWCETLWERGIESPSWERSQGIAGQRWIIVIFPPPEHSVHPWAPTFQSSASWGSRELDKQECEGAKSLDRGKSNLISKLCSKGSRKQSCFSRRIKVLRQESPFGKRGICPGDLPEKY